MCRSDRPGMHIVQSVNVLPVAGLTMSSSQPDTMQGHPATLNCTRHPRPFTAGARCNQLRRLPICHGERRSANRTRWTRGQQQDVNGTAVLEKPAEPQTAAEQVCALPAMWHHSTAHVLYPFFCLSLFLQVRNCAGLQVWAAADDLMPIFAEIDRTVAANLRKVQKAFRDNRIGPHHFQGSTG